MTAYILYLLFNCMNSWIRGQWEVQVHLKVLTQIFYMTLPVTDGM